VRVWIDLANSPHVPLFEPIVAALRGRGDSVILTARDHAQTLPLAARAWSDVVVIGSESPPGRARKALTILSRARALRRFAVAERPDVAVSHGSYSQVVAARSAGIPALTMMDYEYQPANHVSFRLARRVIVPHVFPAAALRRFGADAKTVRYEGFKEELYLAGVRPDPGILGELGLEMGAVTAVLRPPPQGAMYHRGGNTRFDEVLEHLRGSAQIVLLPRTGEQAKTYAGQGVVIPEQPPDGRTLLATADLVVGAGGTMTRESALLGTPTYTVFMAELAAVDAELIRTGRIIDLRGGGVPTIGSKRAADRQVTSARQDAILKVVLATLEEAQTSRLG
jgi:predicted glycosyltransferase